MTNPLRDYCDSPPTITTTGTAVSLFRVGHYHQTVGAAVVAVAAGNETKPCVLRSV